MKLVLDCNKLVVKMKNMYSLNYIFLKKINLKYKLTICVVLYLNQIIKALNIPKTNL